MYTRRPTRRASEHAARHSRPAAWRAACARDCAPAAQVLVTCYLYACYEYEYKLVLVLVLSSALSSGGAASVRVCVLVHLRRESVISLETRATPRYNMHNEHTEHEYTAHTEHARNSVGRQLSRVNNSGRQAASERAAAPRELRPPELQELTPLLARRRLLRYSRQSTKWKRRRTTPGAPRRWTRSVSAGRPAPRASACCSSCPSAAGCCCWYGCWCGRETRAAVSEDCDCSATDTEDWHWELLPTGLETRAMRCDAMRWRCEEDPDAGFCFSRAESRSAAASERTRGAMH